MIFTQAVGVVLFIVAFWFIASKEGTVGWSLWILGLYALGLHAVLIPFGQRMMIRSHEGSGLVRRYRVRMFIGVGHSLTAEFIAIIFTFLGAPFMLIPLGAVIALTGLRCIAPTQWLFRWCDERLRAEGRGIRMTEAWRHLLTDPPPPLASPPS